MRAIWTGSLSFGLVNIPVRLFSAVETEAKINFDMLHKEDMGRIHYARVCRLDGKEIPYDDIVKGYEYEEGDFVVLTEEDFKKADVKKTSTIDVLEFINADEIGPEYFEKPYFLAPQKGAERPYVLLREALKKAGKVGLGRYVLRNREHMVMVAPDDDVITIYQLRFQEELRSPKDLSPKEVAEPEAKEIDMAIALIDQLSAHWEPKKYHDTYTAELKEMIEEKASGKEFKKPVEVPKATEADDILKMLKASLEREYGEHDVDRASDES